MTISEIMTRQVKTCGPDDTCDVAARLMWDNDCGCIPVVDSDQRVVGIITDRDVCMAAYTKGRALGEIAVREAMAHQVFACTPDDRVADVEAIMGEKRVRRLPVVDADRRVVGMVSLNDIARASMRQKSRDLTPTDVAATLAAICQPREQVVVSARS